MNWILWCEIGVLGFLVGSLFLSRSLKYEEKITKDLSPCRWNKDLKLKVLVWGLTAFSAAILGPLSFVFTYACYVGYKDSKRDYEIMCKDYKGV
jgi:hypothetical protein